MSLFCFVIFLAHRRHYCLLPLCQCKGLWRWWRVWLCRGSLVKNGLCVHCSSIFPPSVLSDAVHLRWNYTRIIPLRMRTNYTLTSLNIEN